MMSTPAIQTVHDTTLALAKDLIACRSVTPDDGGSLEIVARRLSRLGFVCERLDRGAAKNLWARRGHSGPRVCFAGHVDVGDHSVIGGLTAIHQFCRIGRFAITGGCSKIVQDVPPFMIADGNPAEVRGINQVGLERAGFPPEKIKPIKEAFRVVYRGKMNTAQALKALREQLGESEEVQSIVRFIEESGRGIIR